MDKIACSVNELYEKYPYPSLPIRNESDLINKLHANVMSKILTTAGLEPDSLHGKKILDAGCGTGEKSCYFSYYGADVTSIDLCNQSLLAAQKLAERFKLKIDIIRCDIVDFRTDKKFDHVFCLGVLHHTGDPYMRFKVLAGMCKPGGTITIGLYNRYGRIMHRAHRIWIGLNAGNDLEQRLDYVERAIYRRKMRNTHELAYVADKYVNPYESYHSIGEVIGWFDKNNITFMGSYPHTQKGKLSALLTQLKWLVKKNGFFIQSGRKS